MSEAARSKESGITRFVTIGFAIPLRVPAGRQRLVALFTLQAGRVPVLAARRLLLREVDLLVAPGTLRHGEDN